MKQILKTALFLAAAICYGNAFSQLYVGNGASLTALSGATVTDLGALTIASGGTLSNKGAIAVTGDVTNNGTTGYDGGALTLNGTSGQTVSGSNTFNTSNLTLNNAQGYTLNTTLSVGANANFQQGLVTTQSNTTPLEFASGATASNASDGSHVNGYVRYLGTGSFDFPVGDNSKYEKITLNLTANSSGLTALYSPTDAGSAPFDITGADATPLKYYNKLEYWDLIPVSNATGTVTAYWDGYRNVGIGNSSDLRVAHKHGGEWLNEAAWSVSGNNQSGYVVISGSVSTWSPFTLGSISDNSTLPITLLNFTAQAAGAVNYVIWNTGVESNVQSYTVQSSTDGKHFASIGTVLAKGGNSSYQFSDSKFSNLTYYRLQINADDGSQPAVTGIVSVQREDAATVSVYPNPTQGPVTVTGLQSGDVVKVYNSIGQTVISATAVASDTSVDLSKNVSGVYFIRVIRNGTVIKTIKIVEN